MSPRINFVNRINFINFTFSALLGPRFGARLAQPSEGARSASAFAPDHQRA